VITLKRGTTTPSIHQSINSISNHHNQLHNQALQPTMQGFGSGHGRSWTSVQQPQARLHRATKHSGVAPPPSFHKGQTSPRFYQYPDRRQPEHQCFVASHSERTGFRLCWGAISL